VLESGQTDLEGKQIASALLAEFGIEERQMVAEAYIDLLFRQATLEPQGSQIFVLQESAIA
jgi:hypothetical protein